MNKLPQEVKEALLTVTKYCDSVSDHRECPLYGKFGCPIGSLCNYYEMTILLEAEGEK